MKTYTIAIKGPSYTFTGTSANAKIDVDALEEPAMIETSFYGKEVFFSAKGKVNVKKARISMSGAEGVHSGTNFDTHYGNLAAFVKLYACPARTGGYNTSIASIEIPMAKWNEWEEKNISVEFGGIASDWDGASDNKKEKRYSGIILDVGTYFSIDDFNVQEDFVGESRNVMIELDIECETLLSVSGNAI